MAIYYGLLSEPEKAEHLEVYEQLLSRVKGRRMSVGYEVEMSRGEGCCPNCGCPDWSDTMEQTHNIFKEFWCNPGYKGCGAEFEVRETFIITGYRDDIVGGDAV